jgi:hypothetical protein
LWLRCGVDEWHLDCRAGGELDLERSIASPRDHDFIAAVRRKEDNRLEFFISTSSRTKVFDSDAGLNDYLRALGLEEIVGFAANTSQVRK